MEEKISSVARAGIILQANQELKRLQETFKVKQQQDTWGRLLPVAMPDLDAAICERMICLGYTTVASAYLTRNFSEVALEEERCEMRVCEVHLFTDNNMERLLFHIVREVREENSPIKRETDEIVFQKQEFGRAKELLELMRVPFDLYDPEAYISLQ